MGDLEKEQGSSAHLLIVQYIRLMKLHRSILERQLNKTGVYRSQHQILMYIADHPSASQRDIARHMEVSTATIAVTLKKLEKGNYIKRIVDGEDNRFNQISITEKGKMVTEYSRRFFKNVEDQMFCNFGPEDLRQMEEYLRRAYENLRYLEPETEREE